MDYAALELEIVTKLNADFLADGDVANFMARMMPDNAEDFEVVHEESIVNVQYTGSEYGQPNSKLMRQDELVVIACYLQCQSMRDEDKGGYLLIDRVKKYLTGYKPSGASTGMWISNSGDWQVMDGETRPFIEFSFMGMHMQRSNFVADAVVPGSGDFTELI